MLFQTESLTWLRLVTESLQNRKLSVTTAFRDHDREPVRGRSEGTVLQVHIE